MTFIEIFLFGLGLAMDAFAVSVCKGLCMKKINYTHAFIIALFFGVFQAIMPFLGFFLGKTFEGYITSVDHWIAFVLLAYIGIKMIRDAVTEDEDVTCPVDQRLNIKELFVLAVATSIDALATGVMFGLMPDVNISFAVLFIGVITFVLSAIGVKIGNVFGAKFKSKAELAGGIILILMGAKILIEHLEIIEKISALIK